MIGSKEKDERILSGEREKIGIDAKRIAMEPITYDKIDFRFNSTLVRFKSELFTKKNTSILIR
jgi:hypothetical protein